MKILARERLVQAQLAAERRFVDAARGLPQHRLYRIARHGADQ
jgi:hypothetical protein